MILTQEFWMVTGIAVGVAISVHLIDMAVRLLAGLPALG
jgi:hypothetical protein